LRRRIETVFGEITKLFPKKIHATTLSGFIFGNTPAKPD
jgi:hypothetical protein